MALKHQFKVSGELTLRSNQIGSINLGSNSQELNAIIKVHSVNGTKEKATADVRFIVGNNSFAKPYNFTPKMDGDNFIKQAYLHLKTLPEFNGAQDI